MLRHRSSSGFYLLRCTPKTSSESEEQSVADKVSLETKATDEGKLPEQGAMFIGEKGRLLLPHFMELPRKIVDGAYVDIGAWEPERMIPESAGKLQTLAASNGTTTFLCPGIVNEVYC